MLRNIRILKFLCSQNNNKSETPDNHFGFRNVATSQKQQLVNQVFHSVANKYDVMNDAMSMGVHRYWKYVFVNQLGNLSPNNFYTHHELPPKRQVLDVAGGTGDISFKILENHDYRSTIAFITDIKTTVFDINQSMLDEGKIRAQKMNLPEESNLVLNCRNLIYLRKC